MTGGERRGFSLLELTAVVAILGLLAAAGVARFGRSGDVTLHAQTGARRLALDLQQCQRRAICTGDNHLVTFTTSGGTTTGYTIQRRLADGTLQTVDGPRSFVTGLTVTPSVTVVEYTFDGATLAAGNALFQSPIRKWRVTVTPATGTARVTEE